MYGSVQCKEEQRIRNNNEMQNLIRGEDIFEYMKAQRVKWWGYLNRMENRSRITNKCVEILVGFIDAF
jgi:hypothetical protein